jgi:hypothetical protein
MFCPKCGAEYRTGFFDVCAECNVHLVAELPPEKEAEIHNRELVELKKKRSSECRLIVGIILIMVGLLPIYAIYYATGFNFDFDLEIWIPLTFLLLLYTAPIAAGCLLIRSWWKRTKDTQ